MTLLELVEALKECPNRHMIISGTDCGLEVLVSQDGEVILHDEFASASSIELALSNSPIIQEKFNEPETFRISSVFN